VDEITGRVFVAHTAFGTVDVIDPDRLEAVARIHGCPEGSGVVCASSDRLVLAASRGAAKVTHIDPDRLIVIGETEVGPKPNGLAWDPGRGQALVADVDGSDQSARLLRPRSAAVAIRTVLPGRPRWCVFDKASDRFLVNIREPASVVSLDGSSGQIVGTWPISSSGPHGLDLDREGRRAFVACDGGQAIVVDLTTGHELASIAISGAPDAIWFNPTRKHLYVGVGDPGLIDVVDTEHARVVDSMTTEAGAKTSAFDGKRQRLYVFLPQSCAAAVFEPPD
jgi:DNA-binding beta-propeller fold protein YncE